MASDWIIAGYIVVLAGLLLYGYWRDWDDYEPPPKRQRGEQPGEGRSKP